MRLYRDFPVICALVDPHLKLCVCLTTNEEVLKGLQRGFPELFTEDKPEHDGPWPLSVIRRVCGTMNSASSHAEQLTERLGLPVIRAMGARAVPRDWEHGNVLLAEAEEGELVEKWLDKPSFPGELATFQFLDQTYYVFSCFKEDDTVCVDLIPTALVVEHA